MVEAHNKIVSIEAFRARRRAERTKTASAQPPAGVRRRLSARSIEHRERMLQFLRTEARAAVEAREVQGRLLL